MTHIALFLPVIWWREFALKHLYSIKSYWNSTQNNIKLAESVVLFHKRLMLALTDHLRSYEAKVYM